METIKYRAAFYDGVPVGETDELSILIASDGVPEQSAELISGEIIKTQYTKDISGWSAFVDETPKCSDIFMKVDFVETPLPEAIVVTKTKEELDTIPVSELITKAAGAILIRENFSEHFRYEDSGKISIRPENPPSVATANDVLKRLFEIRETADKLDNYSLWTLGMMVDEFFSFFGDSFDITEVCDATGRNYNTIITSLGVYREFYDKRRKLSFTHHKEVAYARLSQIEKEWVLDTAEKFGLTVGEQRKIVSFVKKFGNAPLSDVDDKSELMSSVEGRANHRHYIFKYKGEWRKYHGTFESIPNGAHPIFDAKLMTMCEPDGPSSLEEWIPLEIVDERKPDQSEIEAEVSEIKIEQ